MDEISLNLLFSRWSISNSQLSQPLLRGEVLQALKHLDGSTPDSFQNAKVPLALRSPVLDQDCKCSLIKTEKVRITSFDSLVIFCLMQQRIP